MNIRNRTFTIGAALIGGIMLFSSQELPAQTTSAKIVVAKVTSVEHSKVVGLTWYAPDSTIAALPAWTIDAGKFPLSVDDAIRIAHDQLAKKYSSVKGWKLDELNLMQIKNNGVPTPSIKGKYCYLAYLVPDNDADAQQIESSATGELSFYVVILSDGTVLQPEMKQGDN